MRTSRSSCRTRPELALFLETGLTFATLDGKGMWESHDSHIPITYKFNAAQSRTSPHLSFRSPNQAQRWL